MEDFDEKPIDLNKPETHSTEVLLSTIEELERTKKQLEIAVGGLKDIIETAKTGFVVCDACGFQGECRDCVTQIVAEQTLDELKELENDSRDKSKKRI